MSHWLARRYGLLPPKLSGTGRGYDPNQPRAAAGNSNGGQWTGAANGGAADLPIHFVARRRSPGREAQCLLQYRQDTFICNSVGSPICHQQAALRYANCLAGLSIPPLNW